MKTRFKYLILVLFVIFLLVFMTNSHSMVGFFFVKNMTKYNIEAVVTPEINGNNMNLGVSIDPDRLNFGIMPMKSSANKFIEVNNRDEVPLHISLSVIGNVSPFIEINERDFILEKNMEKNISISFYANEMGNYSGELYVSVKKPKHGWFVWMLSMI